MLQDLRDGKYGIDILAATAIITSVLLREYWAGMVIVLMLTGGEALEDYAERRAKNELTSLLNRKPKKATVIRKGKSLVLKVNEIIIGDLVRILPGDVVPVDGIVTEGTSDFDESALTGESLPVTKVEGDQLLSGSINVEGAITFRVIRSAKDSQYEQIIKLVKSAATSQAPFVRLADRYSIPFTILSFIIAGSVWAVTGDSLRFLEVIVVATPCPLLLGAPIALISGMSRAAKHGIIVKTGSSMERLAELETIAFDKTGTLTNGTPVVKSIDTYNGFRKTDVLALAASLENNSSHILARAIVLEAENKNIKVNPVKQVKEKAGHGLSGRIHGKNILIGRYSFIKDSGIIIPKISSPQVSTSSYLAVDGKLAAIISFEDRVRSDAKKMLSELNKMGINHTLMITGDNSSIANKIAKQLGIEKVIADCLPGDKIHALDRVVNKPVGFVGDGVNDAPVLTAADIGIALGAKGSTAASESADVVIMLDDILKVSQSVEIAKRTFFIAKQSILIGILISIGLMGIFATGRFKPIYGAAIQELVDITVILNALRAHGSFRKN